jgi:hypothetical protein
MSMHGQAAPSLLVDITAHGYGHVGQTAPVVNALARRVPGLRVVVRSAAPAELLRRRIECDFHHVPVALDFGMKMASAIEVQVPESAAAYRAYHAGWEGKVRRAAQEMRELKPDLLLANVPCLSLAAARAAGIRAVAMCSLNWADIFRHYCSAEADAADIHGQMVAAYNSADAFLKIDPAMHMPDLRNARSIAPIAHVGCNRRRDIDARLGGGPGKLILVAMGGIEHRLPMGRWPRIPGVRWIIPEAWIIQESWGVARDDMVIFERLGYAFNDVLASCDAVLTKPGYGTFAEAACCGIPVLYVSRRDWPEEPCLVRWLQQNGVSREVTGEQLQEGDLADALGELWSLPRPPVPAPGGAEQAAGMLAAMLPPAFARS